MKYLSSFQAVNSKNWLDLNFRTFEILEADKKKINFETKNQVLSYYV